MVELNGLDIVFLLIIVFAAIRAGFRGFVKELLSTAALFGGIAVAVLFSGIAAVYVQPWVGDGPLAQVVAFLGLFLLVYVVLKIFESALNGLIERINMQNLDRALGFFLGLAEGIFLDFVIILLLQLQPVFDLERTIAESVVARFLLPLLPYVERLIGG